jgi:hypothetical protein
MNPAADSSTSTSCRSRTSSSSPQIRGTPDGPCAGWRSTTSLGLVVLAANDELTIVLVEPELAEMSNSVKVHWPAAPTVSDPAALPELASSVVKLFAAAATKLAHIKSRRSL